MNHNMTSRVFSSAARLQALQETFAGVPHRLVHTLGGWGVIVHLLLVSSFFNQGTTPAGPHTGGVGRNSTSSSGFFFLQPG